MKIFKNLLILPILIFYASHGHAAFSSKSELFRKLYEKGFNYVVELDSDIYQFQSMGRSAYIPKSLVVDLNSQERKTFEKVRIPQLDFNLDTSSLRQSLLGTETAFAYSISDVMVCYDVASRIYKSEQKCYIFPRSIRDVIEAIE